MDEVVSLPMRDGNQDSQQQGLGIMSVVSLPMRDGNHSLPKHSISTFSLLAYL